MLRFAVLRGALHHNPFEPVPKTPRGRPHVVPPLPSQVEVIRSALGPQDAPLVSLPAYAGLRPFIDGRREQGFFLPPDVREWLPADHLAARHRLLDRQPYPDARRAIDAGRGRGHRYQLQPGLELHDLHGLLHRARRPRHADDARGALLTATAGGARALRRDDIGHLAPGARADAAILDAPSYAHLVYRPGVLLVRTTITGARVEHRRA
jgi:hypothetical protein